MKKTLLTLTFVSVLSLCVMAQQSISGRVLDASTQQPVAGANVSLLHSPQATVSDADGKFILSGLKAKDYVLQISFVGYETSRKTFTISDKDLDLSVSLQAGQQLNEAVIVSATRANSKSAVAYTNLSEKDIKAQNLGQDLPYLANFTPSVVVTSDAGAGVGYTGIRIRGNDIARTNITLNGIPVNEAESHVAYFVDLPDLASSVDNIQIQRGLGTSTNGAGAFGSSMNIQTTTLQRDAYAEANNTYGSFNTWKHTARFGTGLLNNRWAFDARLSKVTSDGYMDRANSDLKSFYTSGAYYGNKSLLKFVVMSGKETTYQAWNGVPESRVKGDKAAMQAYIDRNGLSAEDADNLLNSGRTYNSFTYKNQTDNYQQDYYQLHYSKELSPVWNLNLSAHYTKGGGYYEELKPNQSFSKYGLDNVTIGDSTITSTDLIRRRWLQTDYYGLTYSSAYQHGAWNFVLGGGAYGYKGHHFGEVVWAKYASNSSMEHRYYENRARKHDINTYFKTYFAANSNVDLFLDLQHRNVYYSFLGYNRDLESVQQSVSYNFFNPKVGFTYRLNPNNSVYAFGGIGNKEPNRDDLINSTPTSRPKAENLQNIEAGYRFADKKLSFSANYFLMNYKNQLVLTGKINDVGEYTRTNIAKSYRTGIEAEAAWNITDQLRWSVNVTLSQNRVIDFNEYVDNYDSGEQQQTVHSKADIAFSPRLLGGSVLSYSPLKNLTLNWQSKYVGKQYLDNTQNEARKMDAYWVNDLRINYIVKTSLLNEIAVTGLVSNIFDVKYVSNGYTYSYIYDDVRTDENFYFPQAGINFMLGVNVKF
ncbi:iron complex outermembrane recepter protein [Flexibacter flexilis DSM 6793]|uniref:Iron complex outermembrane recepter protein n=1 Tax=Flexibacter flexilis DSM 6793 TaxID=927664 RepID=A0A1I1KWW3_9BACT|nr:TonB-dependent receptor [Flexibacter flexilis]SFC64792.1 iron complex outermembrane recepter protein [Flexibacter flexilis DSM 6793]